MIKKNKIISITLKKIYLNKMYLLFYTFNL